MAIARISGRMIKPNIERDDDLNVNTNTLSIGYTTGNVGIGTASPGNTLAVVGDTLYAMAEKYYGSVNYYWIIGEANEKLDKKTQNIPPGLQLRIPNQLNKILRDYEDINKQGI